VSLVLLLTTLASALMVVLGFLGLTGRLPRNGWAGIRTPYTMQSDEHWYATHREGAAPMIFMGVASFAAGLAFLPFALAGKVGDALASGVVLAQCALLLCGAIGSWWVGTSRARRQLGT